MSHSSEDKGTLCPSTCSWQVTSQLKVSILFISFINNNNLNIERMFLFNKWFYAIFATIFKSNM